MSMTKVLDYTIRVAGLAALVLGLLFWSGRFYEFLCRGGHRLVGPRRDVLQTKRSKCRPNRCGNSLGTCDADFGHRTSPPSTWRLSLDRSNCSSCNGSWIICIRCGPVKIPDSVSLNAGINCS
jgi:hypothetical protein